MVNAVTKSTTATGTETTQVVDKTTEIKSVPKEFDDLMRSMLTADGSGQVSEEELFAANCGEKLSTLKGKDVFEKYKTALAEERGKVTKADGFVPQEEAAINTLKRLVADGTLTSEDGDKIYTQAFKSSQLDADSSSLFDSKGGPNDPTTAMALLSDAISKVNEASASVQDVATESLMSLATASPSGGKVSFVANGAAPVMGTGISETITPKGTLVDGPKGFLFKPVTNNEGKLAILGAQSWTGNIANILLKDSLGNVLEEGRQTLAGVAETGQEKWNFSKQGGDYPKNITVDVVMVDGSVKSYQIPDPSKRYD